MNEIRVLSNGIRVISEYIPYLKSVSIGVWVGNGSCNEKAEENCDKLYNFQRFIL
jgi:predicted Zn-dependent peptidase